MKRYIAGASIFADCHCEGGTWLKGAGGEKISNDTACWAEPVPTVSEWGLGVLALPLLVVAKTQFAVRHTNAA